MNVKNKSNLLTSPYSSYSVITLETVWIGNYLKAKSSPNEDFEHYSLFFTGSQRRIPLEKISFMRLTDSEIFVFVHQRSVSYNAIKYHHFVMAENLLNKNIIEK